MGLEHIRRLSQRRAMYLARAVRWRSQQPWAVKLGLALLPVHGTASPSTATFTVCSWPRCRAYLEHVHSYRQRTWRCKYSGTVGTYEEALLSEQKVEEVVHQVRRFACLQRHSNMGRFCSAGAQPILERGSGFFVCNMLLPPAAAACECASESSHALLSSGLPCLQFPKLYEAEAIRLVHHSLEDADQLCDAILAHLASRFVVVRLLRHAEGWPPAVLEDA